jgi:hypothetical protein
MTLPNFIVGGVPKGGTTSLDFYLNQHPEVFVAKKEPRYFLFDAKNEDHRNDKTGHFPIRTRAEYIALFDGVTTEKAIGEATPFYMLSPVAQQRIPAELPEVRLIFSLREPVARAHSAYWMQVRLGRETQTVEEALAPGTSYVQNGLYAAHLIKWYDQFDRAQIKVTLFDDLKVKPLVVFQDICRFLNIRDDVIPDLTVHNKGYKPKNLALGRLFAQVKSTSLFKAIYPQLPPNIRQMVIGVRDKNYEAIPPLPEEISRRLRMYYREDIAQLERLICRDLSFWNSD